MSGMLLGCGRFYNTNLGFITARQASQGCPTWFMKDENCEMDILALRVFAAVVFNASGDLLIYYFHPIHILLSKPMFLIAISRAQYLDHYH